MKILIIPFLFFCFCRLSFAQTNKISNADQISIKNFVGKWMLTTISKQDSSVPVPPNEANYLIYKQDGSYLDSSSRFKTSHGTWTYDSKAQILYTNEVGGKDNAKVAKLTKEELVLTLQLSSITLITHYRRVE